MSLLLALGICLPWQAKAGVSAHLSWNASVDPMVAGYNIYYGTAPYQFTGKVSVGLVTNTVVNGLLANTVYFFAATAVNSASQESDFSNEAAYLGVNAAPTGTLRFNVLPRSYSSDPLTYSLSGAPAGATIDPTTGVFNWPVSAANGHSTNTMTVTVVDSLNPASSITETLVVMLGDSLQIQVGSKAVYAGQSGSLPITAVASDSLTNLQITLNWPGSQLINPSLSYNSPFVTGSMQTSGNQLIIQLQAAAGAPFSGSNVVAAVNFQTISGSATSIQCVPVASASALKTDGTSYANVAVKAGEGVVVGSQAMLRPQCDASGNRCISLYAMPGNYQLQCATSLAAPTWTPVTNYMQSSACQAVSLDNSHPCIFYRLYHM